MNKITKLEEKIADLKKRFPAHSLKPAMMDQLEKLEETLEREKKKEKSSK